MSFSTPAMTGTSEFRDPKTERPFVAPSFNLPNADNPWKLKVQGACTPQSSLSPWQLGAPSAYSPWQCGAPSACMPNSTALHSPYALANPWSEINPTTSGLAPVDIPVLSESEQADSGKNTNQRNNLKDGSSSDGPRLFRGAPRWPEMILGCGIISGHLGAPRSHLGPSRAISESLEIIAGRWPEMIPRCSEMARDDFEVLRDGPR